MFLGHWTTLSLLTLHVKKSRYRELGLTLAFELSMSSFNSEFRFGILMKDHTQVFQCLFGKTRIEFLDFLVSNLWCKSFYFDVFHQPWWPQHRFLASWSTVVTNEGILGSPRPLGLCVTIMCMSRRC